MNEQKQTRYPAKMDKLLPDCTIEYMRSSKSGGQRRDKKETAVRIRHNLSGIEVISQDQRSRSQNLKIAKTRLIEKIKEYNRGPVVRHTFTILKTFKDCIGPGNRLLCPPDHDDFAVISDTVVRAVQSTNGRVSYAAGFLAVSLPSLIKFIKSSPDLLQTINDLRQAHNRNPIT